MLDFDQARQQLFDNSPVMASAIDTPLEQALNRYSAQQLLTPIASPAETNSAVDGFVINRQQTTINQCLPISQVIAAGDQPEPLQTNTAARIFTGATLPNQGNWVVMQEDCDYNHQQVIIKAFGNNHIRQAGEDFQAGQCVLDRGQKIDNFKLGLIAAAGFASVLTYQPLKVALLTTGNELLQPGEPWQKSLVYDSNQPFIRSILQHWGFTISYAGSIADDPKQTKKVLQQASRQADLIITCGGVSVGERDYLKQIVRQLGSIDAWKVAMKPGKPIAWGNIANKPYFGLPGNPVSAVISLLMICRNALQRLQGADINCSQPAPLTVASDFNYQTQQRCDLIRVRLITSNNNLNQARLEVYPNQQSHILSSLDWADGLALIPAESHITRGQCVSYYPFYQLLSLY